jgi:hypothetical protein
MRKSWERTNIAWREMTGHNCCSASLFADSEALELVDPVSIPRVYALELGLRTLLFLLLPYRVLRRQKATRLTMHTVPTMGSAQLLLSLFDNLLFRKWLEAWCQERLARYCPIQPWCEADPSVTPFGTRFSIITRHPALVCRKTGILMKCQLPGKPKRRISITAAVLNTMQVGLRPWTDSKGLNAFSRTKCTSAITS